MGLNVLLWLAGILYVLTCVFLILVVLIQEGKSGGMGGADSVSQAPGALSETFGAGGAQKGLFKVTSGAAVVFFVLAVALTLMGNKKDQAGGNLLLKSEEPAAQTEGTSSATPAATEVKAEAEGITTEIPAEAPAAQ